MLIIQCIITAKIYENSEFRKQEKDAKYFAIYYLLYLYLFYLLTYIVSTVIS